jgi:phage tail protein X
VDGIVVDDNNSILRTIDGDMLDLIIIKVDDEVRSYVEDIFSITRD